MSKRERDPESPTNVKKQKIDSNIGEWLDQPKIIQKDNSNTTDYYLTRRTNTGF